MAGIELEGVGRRYGDFVAVDNIDLSIKSGEFLTLLGPSGCGKTTTLRMIAGLEKNTSGRILIGDRLVSEPSRNFFVPSERRHLGMVFQSYAIWPHMTVFDNVAYPLRIRRRPEAEIRDRVLKTLALVEMERFADRPAPDLSGGQQQRVAIARALVFEPQVLLLDEPLSNLDARLRVQMGDEFRALQQRLAITAIYVTHDQTEAMSLSDRVVVMQSGRILQQGEPEKVYRFPKSGQVAAFFGARNQLSAEVISCSATTEDNVRLSVRGNGWSGDCLAATPFKPGDQVSIILRPEDFRIGSTEGADATDPVWDGTVTHAVFRGQSRSVEVGSESGPLKIEASPLVPVVAGDRLRLTVPHRAIWAVPAEA